MKPIVERSLEERYIYNNYLRVVERALLELCETIKFASLLYKGVLNSFNRLLWEQLSARFCHVRKFSFMFMKKTSFKILK